ncbi:MAG TPA: cyclic nucleotide-gated ion channel [Rhizomicrobium sp.]
MSDTTAPVSPGTRVSVARAWVYALLEEGELSSPLHRIAEAFLITLIVANVAAVALETIPFIYDRWQRLFLDFERFSVGAYTVEYLLRLWASIDDPRIAARGPVKGRIAFALRPLMIIDFLAFAPSYLSFIFPIDLRVLRIFRLFRLVKLARYSQALPALLGVLYAERSALYASTILLIATVFVSGEVMHIAEGTLQPNAVGTLPDAMYWAVTTLTTTGYGDVTPHTELGKLIAGITMLIGLALVALPIGIIANGFVNGLNRRRFAVTWTILKHQPLFEGFDVEALSDVLECVTADVIREHGQLIVSGEDANAMFLIVSGSAREDREDAEELLQHGDIVGAQALKHQATYKRTVTARTEMRVMALPHEDLRRMARKYPLLRRRVEAAIALEDADAMQSLPPERRVEELEAENAQLRKTLSDLVLGKIALTRDDATNI